MRLRTIVSADKKEEEAIFHPVPRNQAQNTPRHFHLAQTSPHNCSVPSQNVPTFVCNELCSKSHSLSAMIHQSQHFSFLIEHSEVDAEDLLDAHDSDGDLDYGFDSDEDRAPIVSRPRTTRIRGQLWGHGPEALRTSQYHRYDVSGSRIFRFMQHGHGVVTRTLLMELIEAVLRYTPEDGRPTPPVRNQRRAKNGLVMWLDHNSETVWRYLKAQFPVAVARTGAIGEA
jgi:hypothetical protein